MRKTCNYIQHFDQVNLNCITKTEVEIHFKLFADETPFVFKKKKEKIYSKDR